MEEIVGLPQRLEEVAKESCEKEDWRVWRESKNGTFLVKSFFSLTKKDGGNFLGRVMWKLYYIDMWIYTCNGIYVLYNIKYTCKYP